MRYVLAVLMVLSLTQALAQSETSVSPRIIGGTPATQTYDFFVTLLFKYEWRAGEYHWNPFCGGSYIGNGTVVTAAHCLEDVPLSAVTAGNFAILIGDYSADMEPEFCTDVQGAGYNCTTAASKELCIVGSHYTGWVAYKGSEAELISGIDALVVHENYGAGSSGLENDIALIRLSSVPGNASIGLPGANDLFQQLVSNNGSVRVIGHGDVISDLNQSTSEQSAQLLEVDLNPYADAVCSASYGTTFNGDNMICAGGNRKDSCQGDSGGPLFDPLTNTLLGVVSFGTTQCGSSIPGVYADVHPLQNWISVNRSADVGNVDFRSLERSSSPAETLRNVSSRAAITDGCSARVALYDGTQYLRMGNNAGSGATLWLMLPWLLLAFRRKK